MIISAVCQIMIKTKQGYYSIGDRNGSIITDLKSERGFEIELMDKVFDILNLSSNITVMDIGAHIGVVSIGMMFRGKIARAIAIEPEASNFALLKENIVQNGFEDRFLCLNIGVSDHNGIAELAISHTNSGDNRMVNSKGWDTQDVECRTLKTIIEEAPFAYSDIALIWIDVQGHEWHIFKNAKNYLKGIPVVSEIWGEGLRLAGVSNRQFCNTVSEIWTHYWDLEYCEKFPIEDFNIGGGVRNVIFV